MVRTLTGKSQRTRSLAERIARAICLEYRGDPDAEFAGRPMWRHFEIDAQAVLPIVVAIANDIAQHKASDAGGVRPAADLRKRRTPATAARPQRTSRRRKPRK
jgi:hypothetical protein